MSVWDDIDRMQAAHDRELETTRAEVRTLKGGVVKVDDFGRWRCSWAPTRGDRKVRKLTARSGAELVERLKAAIAALPPKKKPGRAKAG